ncbi:MAG: efflux RND transporter periplasmic adaptor subunit [archaeon]
MANKGPKILKDLEELEEKEESKIKKLIKGSKFKAIVLLIILIAVGFTFIYLIISSGRVYVEKSQIGAPIISLTASTPGILERVLVREGDIVYENEVLALVNGVAIRAQTSGVVIAVQNTPGEYVTGQNSIVKMIDPNELRVVGQVEEDKGFADIKPGQKVLFTADAFSGKEYNGVVDLISPTSHQSDIVFSISDKRALQSFDVKVKYDINAYPELKNGMSAKMWIYK